MRSVTASDPDAQPLIELDRATVVRGDHAALEELNLRIVLGQHTAVLGPNGCGKSTFIKLINRELYPLAREGQAPVKVFGLDRWNVVQLRTRLGVVTSDATRDLQEMPNLSVDDAIVTGFFASFVLPINQEVTAQMRTLAAQALQRVGAQALSGRLVAELSTGQMRRVLIARALVHQPQALLLDEPTAGLDVVAQQQFCTLMGELAGQGITLVLVTHHLEEVVPQIDRVVLMQDGRIAADGTRAQTLTSALLSQVYGGPLTVHCENGIYRAAAH